MQKKVCLSSQDKSEILEDTNVEISSSYLKNIKIAVVSGGGIAAIEVPKFVRELRRHGATTEIFITENCLKFIGLDSLRWASQNEVIQNPSGLSEHICTADAVVVLPATADLISKVSQGICSDGATTFLQSALGLKKTIIFCQTMHDSLANSPLIKQNIEILKKIPSVVFIEPRKEEGKQKLPEIKNLVLTVSHHIQKQKKQISDRVLITYGGSRVMLDPVRCLTNLSTGALGAEVSRLFYAMGYNLTILAANTTEKFPLLEGIEFHYLPNYNDMFNFSKDINPQEYKGLIHLVAGSDFAPQKEQINKISSQNETLTFSLYKTKKLISETKLKEIPYKFAAKLTTNNENGLNISTNFLNNLSLNGVFWSTAEEAWGKNKTHVGIFLEKNSKEIIQIQLENKKDIAHCYLNAYENCIAQNI